MEMDALACGRQLFGSTKVYETPCSQWYTVCLRYRFLHYRRGNLKYLVTPKYGTRPCDRLWNVTKREVHNHGRLDSTEWSTRYNMLFETLRDTGRIYDGAQGADCDVALLDHDDDCGLKRHIRLYLGESRLLRRS